MSWSVVANGHAAAVLARVKSEFEKIVSPDYSLVAEEKAVAAKVGDALICLLADQKGDSVVTVSASGSMSGGVSTPHSHSLGISVSTQYGFME